MHHADDEGQDHLGLEARDGAGNHYGLEPGRDPGQDGNVHPEEGVHHNAHHKGAYAQDGHERGHVLHVCLPKQDAADDKGEAIACISHAHGKEQQEEDGNIGSRVKLIVVRAAVHVCEKLELTDKPVVLELDGRVILHCSSLLEVEHARFVQGFGDGGIAFRGGIAHQRDDGVLCGRNRSGTGQMKVQLRVQPGTHLFQFRNAFPGAGHAAEYLGKVCLFLFKLLFLYLNAGGRGGNLSGKGVGTGHHKQRVGLVFGDDREGVFLRPLLLEGFCGQFVEVHGNTGIGQLLQNGSVKLPPLPKIGDFLLQLLDFLGVVGVAHEHAAREAHDVSVNELRNRAVGDIGLPETGDEIVQELDFRLEVLGSFIDGLYAARDVHKPYLLKAGEQFFLCPVQKDKGVFGHGSNHTWLEASSSSACRFFTILEDALERFSSSSM